MVALGRHVEHDPRSRRFAYPSQPLTLRSVDWDNAAPITDQGDLGACVGFTVLDLLNTPVFVNNRLRGSKKRNYLPNSAGLDFYRAATRTDEYPGQWEPQDTGSSGLGGAKAGVKLGYWDTYLHAFSMTAFLTALMQQPVMCGTAWTDSMFDPDKTGLVKPTGPEVGGHEYAAVGYSTRTHRIKFRNHWTSNWGANGRFYMLATDFEQLLADQGDVTIPAPIATA